MATFNITQPMLEAGKLQVDALAAHNAELKQQKSGARDGTKTRNDAMAALGEWMGDFTKIARMALKDRPQSLAKLGVAATPARGSARTATTTSAVAPVVAPSAPAPER